MWCHFKLYLWFLLLFSFLFYSPSLHCLLNSFCLTSSYLLLYALKRFHLVTTLAPVDVTHGWSFNCDTLNLWTSSMYWVLSPAGNGFDGILSFCGAMMSISKLELFNYYNNNVCPSYLYSLVVGPDFQALLASFSH
jgi:hypothetical protein